MSSEKRLCHQCERFDLKSFISRQGEQHVEVPAKLIWEQLYTNSCPICQLLDHCVRQSPKLTPTSRSFYTLAGIVVAKELQIFVSDSKTTRRLDYSIRSCKTDNPINSNEVPFESRQFDPNELSNWLIECDKHDCHSSSHLKNAMPESFRVLDVNTLSICQPKEPVRYCALSYVWGTVGQQFPMHSRSIKSGSTINLDSLPGTIRDAIYLCRAIKCDYLWVDSLCIVQDSENTKARQIHSMDEVYSQSYLCFVAAAGDDADAGLMPYGCKGRKSPISCLTRDTPYGKFAAMLSPQIAAEAIAESTWASRCWTLQEYALSRRVLFFTGMYTFLRCQKSLISEDFGFGFTTILEGDRKWDLPLPPFYRRTEDRSRYFRSTFALLLGQYLRRNLSVETDILNAFTGILTRLEDEIGTHIWGLPLKSFAAALQWKTELAFPTTPRTGFPSWSWAGWFHPRNPKTWRSQSHDVYFGFDEISTNISAVSCYMVSKTNVVEQIERFNMEGVQHQFDGMRVTAQLERILRAAFPPPPDNIQDSFYALKSSEHCISHHLLLWASRATLYVDRTPHISGTELCDYAIRAHKDGAPLGLMHLSHQWRQAELDDRLEFFASTMCLSPAAKATIGEYSIEPRIKIVLIQPVTKSKLSPYRRIQISHTTISLTDWAAVSPKSRLTMLV